MWRSRPSNHKSHISVCLDDTRNSTRTAPILQLINHARQTDTCVTLGYYGAYFSRGMIGARGVGGGKGGGDGGGGEGWKGGRGIGGILGRGGGKMWRRGGREKGKG